MAKVNDQPPRAPQFPWDVRLIVRPKQLERPGRVKKKGDPKNPALASRALLEFVGPGHNADELRLPHPAPPPGHDADLTGFTDRPQLATLSERVDVDFEEMTERALDRVRAAPDRLERLRALLGRERQMLRLVQQVAADVEEIERKRKDETKDEGY